MMAMADERWAAIGIVSWGKHATLKFIFNTSSALF